MPSCATRTFRLSSTDYNGESASAHVVSFLLPVSRQIILSPDAEMYEHVEVERVGPAAMPWISFEILVLRMAFNTHRSALESIL